MKKLFALLAVIGLIGFTASAQFVGSGGPAYAVNSASGDTHGTNYNGLYPTSIAGDTALTNYVQIAAPGKQNIAIQTQGKTVSGTSSMVWALYGSVRPATLTLSAGSYTPDATTPVKFLGYVTNANTTTASITLSQLGAAASTTALGTTAYKGALPYLYVGWVWNIGSGVLTNYSISYATQ